jgi:hypothetical protein
LVYKNSINGVDWFYSIPVVVSRQSKRKTKMKNDEYEKLFKRACEIYCDYTISRYLIVNTSGQENGIEKASRHQELCEFYADVFGWMNNDSFTDTEAIETLHDTSQSLTSYLDAQIGFPLTGRPDYDKFRKLFFERFHELAMSVYESANKKKAKRNK